MPPGSSTGEYKWTKSKNFYKEVLLFASTLFVVKAENIHWNTVKIHATHLTWFASETAHSIANNTVYGTCSLAELCVLRFVYLSYVTINNFDFYYK